jgi:hypothetical protein
MNSHRYTGGCFLLNSLTSSAYFKFRTRVIHGTTAVKIGIEIFPNNLRGYTQLPTCIRHLLLQTEKNFLPPLETQNIYILPGDYRKRIFCVL